MTIRNAETKDIDHILRLLLQVNNVHAEGRPDIFKKDMRKYTKKQVEKLLLDDDMYIYVAVDEEDSCIGYAFCEFYHVNDGSNLVPRKTLYIDDICVDSEKRSGGVGTALYNHVINEAEKMDCHNVTLNVWCFNEPAMAFYEKCGMKPLKIVMEKVLK